MSGQVTNTLLCLVLISGCPAATTTTDVPERSVQALTPGGSRVLLLRWSKAGLELVARKSVADEPQHLKTPLEGPWRVDLLDTDQRVIFTTKLPAPTVVRAEPYAGGATTLVKSDDVTFLVTLPASPTGALLEVWAQQWTLADAGGGDWAKLGQLKIEAGR